MSQSRVEFDLDFFFVLFCGFFLTRNGGDEPKQHCCCCRWREKKRRREKIEKKGEDFFKKTNWSRQWLHTRCFAATAALPETLQPSTTNPPLLYGSVTQTEHYIYIGWTRRVRRGGERKERKEQKRENNKKEKERGCYNGKRNRTRKK